MPIPKPKDDEKKSDFISRCAEWMADNEPGLPQKERLGRCYTSWRTKHPGDGKEGGDDLSAVPQSRHEGLGVAAIAVPWDEDAAGAEASVEQLKGGMALFECGDKETRNDFSFLHHQADGTLVWEGLQAAMERVNQGLPSGASEDVRRQGHNHLAEEYKLFGKEAPPFKTREALQAKVRRSAIVKRVSSDSQMRAKAAPSGTGGFRGYLSVFNVKDAWEEVIRPGAFAKSLKERSIWPLMVRHAAFGGTVADVIGSFTARETSYGLHVDADYLDIPLAQETRQKTDAKIVTGLSVGFREMRVSSGEFEGMQVRFLDELALVEGTIAVAPGNREALIEAAKSLEGRASSLLRDAGAEGQGLPLSTDDEERAKRLLTELEQVTQSLRGLTSEQPRETGDSLHVDVETRRQRLGLMRARIRMVTEL